MPHLAHGLRDPRGRHAPALSLLRHLSSSSIRSTTLPIFVPEAEHLPPAVLSARVVLRSRLTLASISARYYFHVLMVQAEVGQVSAETAPTLAVRQAPGHGGECTAVPEGVCSASLDIWFCSILLCYSMKGSVDDLVRILQEAELAALRVLSKSAAAQDYPAIDRARVIAQRLRALRDELGAPLDVGAAGRATARRQRPDVSRSKTAPKGKYPYFYVADRSLYKVGWSRRRREEYVHRVRLDKVQLVLDALGRLSKSAAGPVTVDQVLESDELKSGGPLPAYQLYVVLALLRTNSLVTVVGRDGYRLPERTAEEAGELLRSLERAS